jgi:hypothetical protein
MNSYLSNSLDVFASFDNVSVGFWKCSDSSLFSFYLITGKPTVLNNSTIYVFGNLGSISNITFLIDCYPKPVVSWIQTLGGKLGTWNVVDQIGGKFKVQSTVLPSKPNHLGNYKALVRNSEGSEELTVILYGYGKNMYCHASSYYYDLIN